MTEQGISTTPLPPEETLTSKMSLPVDQSMGDRQENPDADAESERLMPEKVAQSQKKRRQTGEKLPPCKESPPKTTKSRRPSRLKEVESDSIYQSNVLTVGMIAACLIALIAVYSYNREPSTSAPPPLFEHYEKELIKMQDKYLNQSSRFWTTFLSSLEPILTTDDPELPAVIMLAVPETQHSMALCFADHLAEVLNKLLADKNSTPLKPSLVDGSTLTNLNEDEQKLKIDETIQKIIIENNQRVVIVDRLEKLHPKSVIIFHGYCDNSEAVFKNIAIVFLLEIPTGSNLRLDEEIYAYLFELWNELGPGKTKALLARMANNVAIMQNVDHFIC